MAILLTAAVFLYLELFPQEFQNRDIYSENGTFAEITGRVAAKEVRKDYLGEKKPVIYIIPIEDNAGGSSLKNSMQVQCNLEDFDNVPAIGEYVCVGGKVKAFEEPTNPGEFDSCLYYSTLKISYRLSNAAVRRRGGRANAYREGLYGLRTMFESSLDRALPEADSGIMKAMLLGNKSFIDQDTRDMYQGSGIMHILAISGLHISIIGMGIYRFLKRILCMAAERIPDLRYGRGGLQSGNVLAVIISIAFMYSYGVMCGMGASSFRAIMMFTVRILAPLLGRTYDILSALALAEILLILDQPLYLYNSGFLFSFGAVLGIVVVRPCLSFSGFAAASGQQMKFVEDSNYISRRAYRIFTGTREGLLAGVSILLTTLPVYSSFYYTYPLHSLFLNLLVIPIMGILMIFGIFAMLTGTVWFLKARTAGLPVHLILEFYRFLASGTFLRRKFTWYMGHSKGWQVIVYISCIILFVYISDRLKRTACQEVRLNTDGENETEDSRRAFQRLKLMEILRAVIIVTAFFVLAFHKSSELEIDMIDVGQGDGILISCRGEHMLIDGGSSSENSVGRYQIIPVLKYKGIGKLEAIVLTHEDQDHMSGILEIMDDCKKGGISIGCLILPETGNSSRGDNYHLLEQRAKENSIPVSYINTGEEFKLGGDNGAHFTCLNPYLNMETESANAYSTVLFMDFKHFTALFCGDMEKEGQDNVKSALRSKKLQELSSGGITLLKVAHHGSRYTTDEEFLELTKPRIAMISCGRNNSYGHPHSELIERLKENGSVILRTDEGGFTSLCFDGGTISAKQYLGKR